MKNFLVIPFLIYLSYSSNAQFLEKSNLNLVYNWGKPANVLLDFAKNADLKSKSKLYISGVYNTAVTDEVSLSDFVVSSSQKDADLIVIKTIYKDSIVLIGKDDDENSEVFIYNFSANSFEFNDIRIYDKGRQMGRMYKMNGGQKTFVQKIGTDYLFFTVYNINQIENEFIVDFANSAKSKNVVSAFSGLKKPIKKGVINIKTLQTIVPFIYEETKIILSDNGTKYISVANETNSALFDTLGNNLTGFIIQGEIKTVHNDQTIQIKQKNGNPMIIDFKGNVICDLQGYFYNSSLLKLNYNFYLIFNGNTPEGILTPKKEVVKISSSYSVDYQKESFNKGMDKNGVYVYKISTFKHGAVKKDGEILKDYEPQSWGDWTPGFSDEGLMVVSKIVDKKEKYGYIDKNFNLVIPCIYDHAESFSKGKATVKLNEETFEINTSGKRL